MDAEIKQIFSQNSTSYYYSSLFLPGHAREDVFKLYAYVRTADDFVDEKPQEEEKLKEFRQKTLENWQTGDSGDKIVDLFLKTARKYDFEREWAESFLDSMEMDLHKSQYDTMDETLEYIHGSAEVIGLMMCKVLGIDEEAHRSAKMLGRSMQYCNFIRDVKEDNELGRQYLPQEELEKYELESLERKDIDEESFRKFLRDQISQYREWRQKGVKGFNYIPYRSRVPVVLSSRLHSWTAGKIEKRPMRVYEEKVRPSKTRIALELAKASGGIYR